MIQHLITFVQIVLIAGVVWNAVKAGFCDVSERRCLLSIGACAAGWCACKLMWPGF